MGISLVVTLGIAVLFCWVSLIFKYAYSYASNKSAWIKIRGKWVVVTNATSEIGEALCRAIATRRCKLILLGSNEEELKRLEAELKEHVSVKYYRIDYTKRHNFSFLKQYDIGMLINKIGFLCSEPTKFVDHNLGCFIDCYLRGPLELTKVILSQMTEKKCGYIVNIGLISAEKPRPFYSMVNGVKSLFKTWSESMYYEMREFKVNVEYMETDFIAIKRDETQKRSLFCPTSDELAESVCKTLGSSYFTVPYFPHFLVYLWVLITPKFIVARIRKYYTKDFSQSVDLLY